MEIYLETPKDILSVDKTHVVIVKSISASRHHNTELVMLQLCYADTKELVGDILRPGCLTHSPMSGKDYDSGVYFRTSSTESKKEAVFNVKVHALSSQHENRKFCLKAKVEGFHASYSDSFRTLTKADRKRNRSSDSVSESSVSTDWGDSLDKSLVQTAVETLDSSEFSDDFLSAFQDSPCNADVLQELRSMREAFTRMEKKYDDFIDTVKGLMESRSNRPNAYAVPGAAALVR